MTGRAVLFSGRSEHGSVNAMVLGLADGLATAGWETAVVDTAAPDLPGRLDAALARPVDLFVAVNGIGLPTAGPSFYDRMRAPVVVWLLDHPIYHPDKIAAPVPDARIAVVSPRHADYVRAAHGATTKVFHLAHGAAPGAGHAWAERDIKLLACGSPLEADPEAFRNNWTRHGPAVAERLNRMVEIHHAVPLRPLDDIARDVLALERPDGAAIHPYFATVDTYLRSRIKVNTLRVLATRWGKDLTICGHGWEALLPEARCRGAVPAAETLSLMGRARVTLNLLPPYYASHERVFQAMAWGSAAASTPSELWNAWFPPDTWLELGETADLGEETAWEAIAAAGHRAFTAGGHDWQGRAKTLLNALTHG